MVVNGPWSLPQQPSGPSEEFELTPNSLGAQIETHSGLIVKTLSYLTVNSEDDSHCEIDVSFLGVFLNVFIICL